MDAAKLLTVGTVFGKTFQIWLFYEVGWEVVSALYGERLIESGQVILDAFLLLCKDGDRSDWLVLVAAS